MAYQENLGVRSVRESKLHAYFNVKNVTKKIRTKKTHPNAITIILLDKPIDYDFSLEVDKIYLSINGLKLEMTQEKIDVFLKLLSQLPRPCEFLNPASEPSRLPQPYVTSVFDNSLPQIDNNDSGGEFNCLSQHNVANSAEPNNFDTINYSSQNIVTNSNHPPQFYVNSFNTGLNNLSQSYVTNGSSQHYINSTTVGFDCKFQFHVADSADNSSQSHITNLAKPNDSRQLHIADSADNSSQSHITNLTEHNDSRHLHANNPAILNNLYH
ncbi:10360_t:CDS:2 [Dentiscutata erythropus]|uniref:10360_t:CDS:1 n=1 Tax=Dentiscutata erythropus TaxID=1348616 RepID=A0A9N9EYG2_9GLOM|nr:10360_t:CDS:2 [Dentiscutata erythropus]